jgi:vacuole morphology and inheritance protein 14
VSRYQLAYKIIQLMSYSHMTVNMLTKLAQLTKLLDMPHYAALRMQLLKPARYPYLIHSLKGIIMLLPQGKAFDSLKNRLECSSLIFDAKNDKPVQLPDMPGLDKLVLMVYEQNSALFSTIDKTKLSDYLD